MAGGYVDREAARERLLTGTNTVMHRVHSAWSNFLDFLGRDNVLEVAVGLMIATSFTAVVNSLVNLPEKFLVMRKGPHGDQGYNTIKQASEDGAITMNYGVFLDKTTSFLSLGLVLYAVAQIYSVLSHDSIIKHTVRCPYCRKYISEKAKRCFNCTSWLDGREDRETTALANEAE